MRLGDGAGSELIVVVFLGGFAVDLVDEDSILLDGESLFGVFDKVDFFLFWSEMCLLVLMIFFFGDFDNIFFIIIDELKKLLLNFDIMFRHIVLIEIR